MGDQYHTKKPNPNPKSSLNTTEERKTKKKQKNNSNQFEFCSVCKLNHNQGRRHNFFPNHIESLSSFLSRFQSKLSDVRFFLKNPSLLRPEHASRNRLWCVFCDTDIVEVGSSFACGNAINHLASADHLKNLKSFLWKYGRAMDCVDSFRISEVDLAKWEKKCKSLMSEAASEGSRGPTIGPLNDIHFEVNSEYTDSFDKNNSHSLNSSFSNSVVPLQNYTNEKYQVSHSEPSKLSQVGHLLQDSNLYLCAVTQCDTNPWGSNHTAAYVHSQHSVVSNGRAADGGLSNGVVYRDERTANGESSSQCLQNLTNISSIFREEAKGNVHSGAPPPWFNTAEANQLDDRLETRLGMNKTSKLNPKRVGAAWAERRKIELEMVKRGELVGNSFDVNWLPNFGRVWQSGTRKESRKEFEVETEKSRKVESQAEMPMQLQPYVSKRMRRG